jgi:hypothetical protein
MGAPTAQGLPRAIAARPAGGSRVRSRGGGELLFVDSCRLTLEPPNDLAQSFYLEPTISTSRADVVFSDGTFLDVVISQ